MASSAASGRVGPPSTGGAATRTLSVPSARQPTISLRARPGLDAHAQQILLHRAFVRTARPDRPRPRRRAAAGSARAWRHFLRRAAAAVACSAWISTRSGLLAARRLHRLLAAQLGLAHDQSASRRPLVLHLLARRWRGHERVLQAALALARGRAARSSWAASCSLSSCVLLEQRLVVARPRPPGRRPPPGTSKPRNIRTVNCCWRMSWGLMRIGGLRSAISGSAARSRSDSHQKRLEEVDREEHDHRRQVERPSATWAAAGGPARSTGSVTRYRNRTIGLNGSGLTHEISAARDDDPEVRPEHEVQQPGKSQDEMRADEHQAGPRPSSRERSVARSTAPDEGRADAALLERRDAGDGGAARGSTPCP